MKSSLALMGIFLLITCPYFSIPVKAQSCYELVWSDEFNYEGLPDSEIWSYEVGASGWGNNELQYYTRDRKENARVENGNLIIEARREGYMGASYTSARLITYTKGHSFRYGKIEARIRLPYGQGIWPAFWMLGNGIFEGTSWPGCGEIDIMEMVGGGEGRDDVVHGTVHWLDASNNHAQYGGQTQLIEGIFADNFHVFSVEWNATSIKWFLDGKQYHVVDITPAHMSEFHKDFFILLNIAVGGNWPGNPNASTIFPQKMYVDYIRVYQSGASPEMTGPASVVPAESGIRFSTVESEDISYNWSVPDDAVITEGQGTHSILVDWACDSGTVYCDITGICDRYLLSREVTLKEMEIAGSDRIEAYSKNLDYSIPAFREATYQWILPEGVLVNDGLETNSINVDWNSEEGEILVKATNYCGYDTAVLMVSTVLQQPYPDPGTPHPIPGTISPVEYDSGGEGISYHDTEPSNLGNGSRQDEGVDTEINDGGETVGWLEPGEWMEYTVNVKDTDLYNIDIRTASTNSFGKFKLQFNGEDRTDTISVPLTGSWSSFTTISLKNIRLYDTDNLMRIYIVNGLFNLGRLTFSRSTTSVNEHLFDPGQVYLYLDHPNQILYVRNIQFKHRYTVMDMTGRLMDSGILYPDAFIPVEGLPAGAYLLILERDQTRPYTGRFIKIRQ